MKIKENKSDTDNGFNIYNNMNYSIYEIDKNINNDDFIRKIQKNYIDYYNKNISEIEKLKFYNDILNSIDFDNKRPEIKDILIINRLISIITDDNQLKNINNPYLSSSVFFCLF